MKNSCALLTETVSRLVTVPLTTCAPLDGSVVTLVIVEAKLWFGWTVLAADFVVQV